MKNVNYLASDLENKQRNNKKAEKYAHQRKGITLIFQV